MFQDESISMSAAGVRQLFEQRLEVYSRLQIIGLGGFYKTIKYSAGFSAAAGVGK